jgi:CTP:molybdopterin cytidylyltransferase MocA
LALPRSTNPRQFITNYAGRIEYVQAGESILRDLDTPEDYDRQHP